MQLATINPRFITRLIMFCKNSLLDLKENRTSYDETCFNINSVLLVRLRIIKPVAFNSGKTWRNSIVYNDLIYAKADINANSITVSLKNALKLLLPETTTLNTIYYTDKHYDVAVFTYDNIVGKYMILKTNYNINFCIACLLFLQKIHIKSGANTSIKR